MIDERRLRQMEQMFNSRPSPLCGGQHGVSLSLKRSHSSAICSMVWLGDEAVFVEVTGGCEGFSSNVMNFLVRKAGLLKNDPFDHIM